MNQKFVIAGRHRLEGTYRVQGNKNAALPLIAAALLAKGKVVLRKMPRIVDVENLLKIVETLGVEVQWEGSTLLLDSRDFQPAELRSDLVEKLRGAVLLLGPLAPLTDTILCPVPGGCPIGRRSFDMHWKIFSSAGFSVREDSGMIEITRLQETADPVVYLEESSVTATENALLLFSALGGGTIGNPAREPHVLQLVDFLRMLGCEIELHPLYFRVKMGVQPSGREFEFETPADFVDAGTIAIAVAVAGGDVTLEGVRAEDLVGIQPLLERFGIGFEDARGDAVRVKAQLASNPARIVAGPWPSFPTDLVSLVIVLATQGNGLCLIHDWMYEARMFFVDKLVRMGAHITMCDPHRVLVEGPTRLRGSRLESPDIRAGMALVVAGLCAEGVTIIEHAEVIMRGYEDVAARLRAIGAVISEQ
jgi:UDP-N-acetylglucosamine 1-carboxyvinyltransferase